MHTKQILQLAHKVRRQLLVVLPLLTIVGAPLAVTSTALADGTGSWCTDTSTPVLCWYANGTSGNQVFGHSFVGGVNENTDVKEIKVCTHNGQDSQYVQSKLDGDATNCPFTNPKIDQNFDGKEIVRIENVSSTLCFLGKADATIVQGSCGSTGYAWVTYDTGLFVNVYAADQTSTPSNINGTSTLCTDNVANDALLLKPIAVLTNCLWSLH